MREELLKLPETVLHDGCLPPGDRCMPGQWMQRYGKLAFKHVDLYNSEAMCDPAVEGCARVWLSFEKQYKRT